MISRQAKKLVPAREQLPALTPAELTEVSGGCGWNGDGDDWRRPLPPSRRLAPPLLGQAAARGTAFWGIIGTK